MVEISWNVATNLVTMFGDGGLNGLLMTVQDGGDWLGMVLGFPPGPPTGGMPSDTQHNDSNGTKQMRKRKK